MTLDDLLPLWPRELSRVLAQGRPLAPEQLADTEFHGVSLGLPAFVERLAWKKFKKVFRREGPRVRGWNVAVEQTPLDAPWRDRWRRGERITYGFYEALADGPHVLLDYGRGGNRRLDPLNRVRDPLVALDDAGDLLLGASFVSLAGRRIDTPAYFALLRGEPLTYEVSPPSG